LSTGLSLKPQHFDAATSCRAHGLWFEVHPENYMVEGGPRLRWLEAVRAEHALSLHGVSLSLGGEEPLDAEHLQRLAQLVHRLQPALVSEHLAWSRSGGSYFPDLLPVPRTVDTLQRLAAHIDQTQSVLGRSIAIENPSHYLHIAEHAWDETDFLAELVRRTGCSLLLDVNNVYVSAQNLGFSASDYLARFPGHFVSEIHLAGHTPDPTLGDGLLIDSHDSPIAPAVWALYENLVTHIGPRPTLIERDGNLPTFDELWLERSQAEQLLRRTEVPA
jgi:uncharacterized protein (UPF0276 family)